jgi:hypothetical protein
MATPPKSTQATVSLIPWWVSGIVWIGILLTATGAILALVHPETLVGSDAPMNQAAYVYAGYLVSRDLALAILLLVMLLLKARRVLAGLMALTILTQVIDAIVDLTTGRISLVPPILLLAIAFLIGLMRITGPTFWAASKWQDF